MGATYLPVYTHLHTHPWQTSPMGLSTLILTLKRLSFTNLSLESCYSLFPPEKLKQSFTCKSDHAIPHIKPSNGFQIAYM